MAEKKLEKGSDEWMFFQDYFRFRQKYYEADNKDEWFEGLIKAADILFKKYKETHFSEYAKKLIIAHMDDVERRCM